MPDLIGVTNTTRGQDVNRNQNITNLPKSDTDIKKVLDPTHVAGSDKTQQQDSTVKNQAKLRYESNFGDFLERLENVPDLSQELLAVLIDGLEENSAGGKSSHLLQGIPTSEEQVKQFLLDQLISSTKFSGAIFKDLRNAYMSTESQTLKRNILEFLKIFNDYASTNQIEGNLVHNLRGIVRSIPATFGRPMAEILAELENGIEAKDRDGNLKLLKRRFLPLVSDYVSRTNDMGRARSTLTNLLLDITRYENGSKESLLQAFAKLRTGQGLSSLNEQLLLSSIASRPYKKNQFSGFVDELIKTLKQSLDGSGKVQDSFNVLMNSMLVGESVYMQLNHLIIPMQFNGRMLLSELWIDPNDCREQGSGELQQGVRMLLQMDVQSLGRFDLVLHYSSNSVQINIQCPPKLSAYVPKMEWEIRNILSSNGLPKPQVTIVPMKQPMTVQKVFPEIYQKGDSVNVTV